MFALEMYLLHVAECTPDMGMLVRTCPPAWVVVMPWAVGRCASLEDAQQAAYLRPLALTVRLVLCHDNMRAGRTSALPALCACA